MGTTSDESPVRWGVLGLGWVASDFVGPAMQASTNSRIDACLGSNHADGEAFAQQFGVPRVHANMSALMNDPELDAIYIALPNAMHHEAVLAGAAAGKHMLCEKPFAIRREHAVEPCGVGVSEPGVIGGVDEQVWAVEAAAC